MTLFADTETFSATPITAGTYRYAADAEVMLFAYAIDDGPVRVWDRTAQPECPLDLAMALLEDDDEVVFHNAMFDRAVLRFDLPALCPPLARWRCSMVRALAHGLPGKLEKLGELFGLNEEDAKLKEGRDLIQLFCKPRPKTSKLRRATRETHPVEWARFVEYAAHDIKAMREIWRRLPAWNYRGEELALWHLDQRINDRGVQLDIDLARAAVAATEREKARLAALTHDMTDGYVGAATQRDKLLDYLLAAHDIELPDLQTSTIERLLDTDPDLPVPVRELLAVRVASTKASTSKYKRALAAVNLDGRARGLLQFAGAMRTARWAGRTIQPQNFPRPTMAQEGIDAGIEAVKAGVGDLVLYNAVRNERGETVPATFEEWNRAKPDDRVLAELMPSAAMALRGLIVAPKGRKLVVADLSNIEGRDQAWLAGEEWKLDAFRAFDSGQGHDLYKVAYSKSFGIPPGEVTKPQRQIGKVQELALGYEGGVGAFVTMAAGYNMDLQAMARQAWDVLPADLKAEAIDFHAWQVSKDAPVTRALPFEVFVTCDVFKRGWRRGHAQIASFWKELEAAAIDATANPGETLRARKLAVRRDGAWLRIVLPSGRALCYPRPEILEDGKLAYRGINQYSRKWCRMRTYGGSLFENACQAVARDILAANMPRIEEAGYRIVLSVHDEVICEAPQSPEFNAAHLSSLLSANPKWAPGIPLAAAGFETYRYRKD